MTFTSLPVFAQAAAKTSLEFGRIQSNADYILPVAIFVAIGLFVWAMYRRDAVDLHPLLVWLLVALRTATFLGLLILYLQPQWRTEHEMVRNSRALLLVDTSLSMGLADPAASVGPANLPSGAAGRPPSGSAAAAKSRAQQVAAALAESDLLRQLRKTHDVLVFRFSEGLDRDRVVLDKLLAGASPDENTRPPAEADQSGASVPDGEGSASSGDPKTTADDSVDWRKFLAAGGAETQLGTALSQLINDQSGSPLSGIIVFTDGGQNAGIAPEAAIQLARKAKVPIFPIGVGSPRNPTNVRVSDLVAPARAYPGDNYVATGYIQAQGLAGQVAQVQLLWRESREDAGGSKADSGQIVASHPVTLAGDGEVTAVKFELTPQQTGRRTLCFRIQPPPGDRNPADNQREAEIEIVDRSSRVLIIAGGPTREYRFLRTFLYRDRSTTLDVLLQTAQPGISQEADKVLDNFPATREEMYVYDCVVAFDPDWRALSLEQVDLLETWVAEKGGGLIVVAGPVFTGRTIGGWVEDKNMAGIRALYPVEFHRRFSVLQDSIYTAAEPWPLEFTREGLEAEYLWLDDTATAGREAWASFSGVYSYCPVRGPKPGATVLARFSDPRTGWGGELPVFFAGQFYGSGQVFYIGSGEIWRLRRLDPTYFERFYTKLIRHVSQGRLLRQSTRGVLLVGRERYLIGNTVEVRAQLTNARLEPLEAPNVPLQVIHPDRTMRTVTLETDPSRVGTYAGRFPVVEEGSYQLDLAVPESEDEHLTRRIHVDVPDLERENPQRNDALLSRIAQGTDGKYYDQISKALGTTNPAPIVKQLKDRTRTVIFTAAPDPLWERTWLMWMMFVLCGLLCLEWLIRRLAKLA
jgi:hypothetical protein